MGQGAESRSDVIACHYKDGVVELDEELVPVGLLVESTGDVVSLSKRFVLKRDPSVIKPGKVVPYTSTDMQIENQEEAQFEKTQR